MKVHNLHDPSVFLNKLNFMTWSGDLDQVTSFTIGSYKFIFDPPLDKETQSNFFMFMRTENLYNLSSVAHAIIWFLSRDIPFRLKLTMCSNWPLKYILKDCWNIYTFQRNIKTIKQEIADGCYKLNKNYGDPGQKDILFDTDNEKEVTYGQ